MTTILVINAVSSLVAGLGIGGFYVRRNRRARAAAVTQPVYVTAGRTRRQPQR
ncbi:MAG TPA: hypothetical protein VFN87_14570 [Solirubrobacteraceae bacterium]|nr:hypothetical protein [Solirubrobacteraceae bacterium]